MSNLILELPLVDGGLMPFIDEGDTCEKAIKLIAGDDFGAPPRCVNIIIKTESGKLVKLVIPNDSSKAIVLIDGELI